MKFEFRWQLLVLGLVSVLLTLLLNTNTEQNSNQYWPGFFCGVTLGSYFIWSKEKKLRGIRFIGFVFTSVVAYMLASFSAMFAFISIENMFSAILIGGIVGTGFLLIGIHYFCFQLTWNKIFWLLVAGGFLSISWFIPNWFTELPIETRNSVFGSVPNFQQENFLWLFIVWQPGMSLLIGGLEEKQTIVRKSR